MRHTVTILFILIGSLTYAQSKENVIVRKYTQKDGINSYNIRRVTEDRYGFIWIATQDGLSRFDGRNFVPYTKNDTSRHRICGIDIRELIPDSTGDLLWVLPGEVGVNAINTLTGEVVKTIPIPPASNEDWNICMTKAGDYLWIGTFTGLRVYNIAMACFETLPTLKPAAPNSVEFEVRSILRDNNGNIWVAYTGHGIVIYNGQTRAILRTIPISALNDHLGSHAIRFLRSVETAPGSVLFATNQGLRRISFDAHYSIFVDNHPCKALPALDTDPLEYITLRRGSVLVAGPRGLLQFDSSLTHYILLNEHSNSTDSKWLTAVQCIFPDKKGDLWLGCQEGLGFIADKKSPFEPFVYDEGSHVKLDHVRYIYPLPNGDILAGLWYGIVEISSATEAFTIYDKAHTYQHIFQDKIGRIIVSRPDGLFTFDKGKVRPLSDTYPEFAAWPGVYINSHIVVNDTLTILGTESNNGILCWDPLHGKIKPIGKDPGILTSNIVNNIYRDSRQRLWVLSDNTINILSPDLTTSRELTFPHKLYFDMCEAGGYYWLASYGSGLIQLDSSLTITRIINTGTGLANDGVYQLYDLAAKLLVTTNNGISVVDLNTFKCHNYYSNDGLHSNGFEEVCGLRKGGYIYAGGLNGFTIIDPTRFGEDTIPPLFYFQDVRTQTRAGLLDTANLRLADLTIPNTWLQTNIGFAGLYYPSPVSVRYQYRILEQDTSWLQPDRQASLNLIGLSPGSYTIEARATNKDGYWSAPARLHITFQPKWFETQVFRLGVFLAVVALFYTFYRFRLNEVRKQQQIRTGIASDLHDDIGSLLHSVKVFSHLAQKEPAKDEHFLNIDESLTQATTGLRDMIWVLDNSEDTISELMDRIKKFAVPVTAASGIRFDYSFRIPEKSTGITKTEKRNLLLIAKEAINNSIKYSGCRTITVECAEERNGVCLRIEDDGTGFDTHSPSFGNGLRNMTVRASQIRYSCKITSSPEAGTRILISKQ
jgi:ligand-binding sensor domain-containing protein